ncbi:hypothetical protein E4U32_002625 [Claviceps aff. humidiphila group G2b]|nr:hypothetical protein E4U32_002625 [Claviceps aff. humidiphila group G2b]
MSPKPSTSPKTCHKRPRRSARNSLNGILRQHAGESLYVRPMRWTDQHSKLLGARFVELPPCNTPRPRVDLSRPSYDSPLANLKPSEVAMTLCEALYALLEPTEMKSYSTCGAVDMVLSTLWPEALSRSQFDSSQHVFYGDKVYKDALYPQVLWNYPGVLPPHTESCAGSNSSMPTSPHDPAHHPMMCYLSKNELAMARERFSRVNPGPGGHPNVPIERLMRNRVKALMPANPDHDAVFVSLFLAMAQHHFYGPPTPISRVIHRGVWGPKWEPSRAPPRRPPFENVKLRILTHDSDTAEFILYTASVTAEFLDRFYNPSGAPLGDEKPSGMDIEYVRVPIWPLLGLRERLGTALGEEIVGPFDANRMVTWTDVAPIGQFEPVKKTLPVTKNSPVTKRKRGSDLEVRDDEREGEETNEKRPRRKIKRQRLQDGSSAKVAV